jgi:lipoate-protein ligase A
VLLLDLSLPTAAENLALDEALLETAENGFESREVLRVWECPQTAVILGRSCKVSDEVRLAACETANIPVFRRTSGGGTVVIGPGCLQYSLLLSYELRPHLRMLDEVHRLVLNTTSQSLNQVLGSEVVQPRGTSDLAIGEQKISGNSVRCKRNFLLYHGTLLYDFDLSIVERLLLPPPKEPDYRVGREHQSFISNLPLTSAALRQGLIHAWKATDLYAEWPEAKMRELLASRYSQRAWNFER